MNASACSRTLALVLTVATLAGCAGEEAEQVTPEDEATTADVEVGGAEIPAFSEEVRTAFQPTEDAPDGVTGVLRYLVPTEVVADGGETAPRIHVRLEGLPTGEHTWALYNGPCNVDGGVELPLSPSATSGGLTDYLTVGPDGTVETEVAVPPLRELFVEAGNYSVRVLAGTGLEAGPMVACANL